MAGDLSVTLAADAELVRQTLLDEHAGNLEAAFRDLCLRFAYVVPGVSWGAIRAAPEGGDVVRALGNVVQFVAPPGPGKAFVQ